jgi:hypothetical protein
MMPLLLAAAQLLFGDLYVRDAEENTRVIIEQTEMRHSISDRSIWTELAGRIAADLARAERHLGQAPPELSDRLRAAERANVKLQASLAVEDHAQVREQAESVLAQLILARQALAATEQAAGVTALERVQPPIRQPVLGEEHLPPGDEGARNPRPVPKQSPPPPPEQPGNVTEPSPATQRPR